MYTEFSFNGALWKTKEDKEDKNTAAFYYLQLLQTISI